MAAYVADDLDHKRERTAREFVSEFRGLSGSVKPAAVLDAAGFGRPSLADFFPSSGSADRAAIAGLLAAMKFNSKAVAPEQLGIMAATIWKPILSLRCHHGSFLQAHQRRACRHPVVEAAFASHQRASIPDSF